MTAGHTQLMQPGIQRYRMMPLLALVSVSAFGTLTDGLSVTPLARQPCFKLLQL
jgi:hypothetical protein